MTWRSDNENASDVRIISNSGLEPITLAATITTAAITKFKEPGTATIDLKVNHQPAINLRKLLKLKSVFHRTPILVKHNQQSNDFNNPKSRE